MKEKCISFIVPVYNTEDFLARCIESLLSQGLYESEYEIILINDGSTDNSQLICGQYVNTHKNIKYFYQCNQGVSVARNFGLQQSSGKYIMFVDSDDFLELNVLKNIIIEANQKEAELFFFRGKFYPNCVIANNQLFECGRTYTGEYVLLHGMKISSACFNIYKRDFLIKSKIKFFPGLRYGEDVDFNYRLYPKVKKMLFSKYVVYVYYVDNKKSVSHKMDCAKNEKKCLDNLIIADNLLRYIKIENLSHELQLLYIHIMNSILAGQYLYMMQDKSSYTKDFVIRYIAKAKEMGLYPIHGKTSSLKTTLLSLILNNQRLYLFLVRIFAK